MTNWYLSLLGLSIFALLIQLQTCNQAHAYPTTVREGYAGKCASCHVSPSGGGVLTEYGRAFADEMATWAYEGEGRLLHKIEQPKDLLFGGDTRWVNYTSKSRATGDRSKIMVMQADLEIALAPIKDLWLVGTVGKYNEDDKYEHRRYYLLLNLSEHLLFRAGLFHPRMGIQHPDHRLSISPRQGSETYNAEATYTAKNFALTLAALGNQEHRIRAAGKEGFKTDTHPGFGVVGSTFMDTFELGTYHHRRTAMVDTGVFASAGWGDVYLLSELRRHQDLPGLLSTIYYGEMGYGVLPGLDVYVRAQGRKAQEESSEYTVGLNWLPRPHWQWVVEVERQMFTKAYVDSFLVMGHYNL